MPGLPNCAVESSDQVLVPDLLRHFEKATREFKLCPNRVWAVAKDKLPDLVPESIEPIPGHEKHELCTFGFCEYSQRDFTAIEQRHECNTGNCGRLRYLFSKETLDESATNGRSTVWGLDGKSILEPPRPYIAISHVWSDGTGNGAWQEGEVNECLYTFFKDIAIQFQCEGIWWDTLCIPKGKEARTKAIRNLPSNYQDARITLVHDCFLRGWEWDERTACFGILMSPWFSRGWTAVELAKSRKVKVIFKGPHGPLIKDLDEEILAKGDESYGPRIEASQIIRKLRKGVSNLDQILTVLGPRHTSWPKDMATISALLVGIAPSELQQDTYKSILKKIGKVSPRHLFHNAATMFQVSWCPNSLLNMPVADSDHYLRVEPNWDLTGQWRIIPVNCSLQEKCVWNGIHALRREKVRDALKHPESHLLLVDPEAGSRDVLNDKAEALLVRVKERTQHQSRILWCQYVGALYFHPAMLEEYINEEKRTREPIEMEVGLLGDINSTVDPAEDAWKLAKLFAGGKLVEQDIYSSSNEAKDIGGDVFPNTEITQGRRGRKQSDASGLYLISAVKSGEEEAIRKELSRTPSLVDARELGSLRTALHYATWRGHENVVKQLLDKHADVNLQDNEGQTPLHLAAERGEENIVLSLLGAQASDTQCKQGQTALHRAAWGGSLAVVKSLLSTRTITQSYPHTKDIHGNTALHIAAEKGFEPIVTYLLNNDMAGHRDLKGCGGMTPLHYAAIFGHEAVVRELLKSGAKVNAEDDKINWTALHLAAISGKKTVVKLLLENAADVESADSKVGWTPLHLAVMNGHEAVIRLLLDQGSDFMRVDNFGWSVWNFAAINGHEKLLPKNNTKDDLLQVDKFRWTQLHLAALTGPKAVFKLLLEQDAEIDWTDIKGQTPLHGAAENGCMAIVQLLLEKGANVQAKTRTGGQTPLARAAKNGHQLIAQLLLEKGANVNAKDIAGRTPLWDAVDNGHVPIVQLLVEKGADINVKDRFGGTPLSKAVENGHVAIAQMLVNKGAAINARNGDGGWTLLGRAAENLDSAALQLLLKLGADINAFHRFAGTPLLWAAENGHEAVVELLVASGADMEFGNKTPLLGAARNGHEAIVKLLVASGANVESVEFLVRETPLRVAAENGHEAIAKLLVDNGADVNSEDSNGGTPLLSAARNGHKAVAELLVANGANVNHKSDGHGDSPLSEAAGNGHEAIVKLLVDNNADLECQDNSHWTPLSLAAGNGHGIIVKLLVANGADINSKDKFRRTPLLRAAETSNEAIAKLLVANGADINSKDRDGQTPLFRAARRGNEAIVKLLITNGANINTRDSRDQTPLSQAAENDHEAIAELLIAEGADM